MSGVVQRSFRRSSVMASPGWPDHPDANGRRREWSKEAGLARSGQRGEARRVARQTG
ncbi:MAG TPA: hypothetical protein VK162_23075 [Streptosporangiaceae bacterium]|nr:hypothetical protein [Streptosporangiaceae bacterium]